MPTSKLPAPWARRLPRLRWSSPPAAGRRGSRSRSSRWPASWSRTGSRSSSSATPTPRGPLAIPPPELPGPLPHDARRRRADREAQPRLARDRGAAWSRSPTTTAAPPPAGSRPCSRPPTARASFLQGRTDPDPDERQLLHGLARSVDVPVADGLVRDLQHGLPAGAARAARRLRRGLRLRGRGHRPRVAGDRGRAPSRGSSRRRSSGTPWSRARFAAGALGGHPLARPARGDRAPPGPARVAAPRPLLESRAHGAC